MNMRETVLSFYINFIFYNRNQTFSWARWKISNANLASLELLTNSFELHAVSGPA